jgi:hypothetical protein
VDVVLHRPRILLQESQRQAANCVHLFTSSDLIVMLCIEPSQSSSRELRQTEGPVSTSRPLVFFPKNLYACGVSEVFDT